MSKKFKFLIVIIFILIISMIIILNNLYKTEEIVLGYQSPTAVTWSATIMKEKKLIEEELKKEFPQKKFKIKWVNSPTGIPLVNGMINNKIDIIFLGDMPALIAGSKSSPDFDPKILAIGGRGKNGKNQAILSIDKNIKSIEDLKNKKVSTAYGSSAHRILLHALQEKNMVEDVNIIFQDLNVGIENMKAGKVDAVAVWEPYIEELKLENANVLFDAEDMKTDYLSTIVVNNSWNNKFKNEIYSSFLRALEKSNDTIENQPEYASKIFAKETGFNQKVTKKMISNINYSESKITNEDYKTFKESLYFLESIKEVKPYNLKNLIDLKLYDKLTN